MGLLNFKLLCTSFFRVYPCTYYYISKIMMRSSVFPWSNVNINAYGDNVCISKDNTNSLEENVPPPLPVTYQKIYPILVPKINIYDNTSHFIIVFVDVVHA